jgi:MYXO-CTERM domain-containing protein
VARGVGANGTLTDWSAPACFEPALDEPADKDDEGCGCASTTTAPGGLAGMLAAVAALVGWRRRRAA